MNKLMHLWSIEAHEAFKRNEDGYAEFKDRTPTFPSDYYKPYRRWQQPHTLEISSELYDGSVQETRSLLPHVLWKCNSARQTGNRESEDLRTLYFPRLLDGCQSQRRIFWSIIPMRAYVRAQHKLSEGRPGTVLPYKQSELAKAASSSSAQE